MPFIVTYIIMYVREMKKQVLAFCILLMSVFIVACNDDAGFSSSPALKLEFSSDTISFDTLFTDRVSPSAGVVVYNRNKNALRISDVRLASGGTSGFSVIVDGQYGHHMSNLEVRAKDSLFVVASVKLDKNGMDIPCLVEDSLLFTLESGVVQQVVLSAHGRDVTFIYGDSIVKDSTMSAGHYVVYDSLCVNAGATLNIEKNATFYFHENAFMKVDGVLNVKGEPGSPVVFRGDRTDNLFDYLPYDRVPGKWGGLVFGSTSNGNTLEHCDIHSAEFGVKVERGDTTVQRLVIRSSKIQNFTGNALETYVAHVDVENSLIANAQGNCVKVVGGNVSFVHCTIANFYVWKQRDVALALHNSLEGEPMPLHGASFRNCIITGTKQDELMGYFTVYGDTVPNAVNYYFENSLINTVDTGDSCFVNIVYDDFEESPFAKEHFAEIDNKTFYYDFHLTDSSSARGIASGVFLDTMPYDLDGTVRGTDSVDAGCYVYRVDEGSAGNE